MSLEHELVFGLRDKGNSKEDVLEIVKYMADPKVSPCKPVGINQTKIEKALKKYDLIKRYNNQARDISRNLYENKKKFLKILEKKISEKKTKLMERENVISVRIKKSLGWGSFGREYCEGCKKDIPRKIVHSEVIAWIRYFKEKSNGILYKVTEGSGLLIYCRRCGTIKFENNLPNTDRKEKNIDYFF